MVSCGPLGMLQQLEGEGGGEFELANRTNPHPQSFGQSLLQPLAHLLFDHREDCSDLVRLAGEVLGGEPPESHHWNLQLGTPP